MYTLAPYTSGEKLMNHASCKLHLGVHSSFAPCLDETVELNNYWAKALWELVGFQALAVFKLRLEAFLQVSIFVMHKLLGLLPREINEGL